MASKSYAVSKQLTKPQVCEFILENPQISVQKSVEFLKKLTVVAISSISYLRSIFPPSAFKDRSLNGMSIKILKGDDDIPGTTTMINWIKSAFDAVESHYLKKMIIVVQTQNIGTTIEVYTFNFTYNHEAISCQLSSESTSQEIVMKSKALEMADIKKSTTQLLRSILTLTTTLKPLPDDCEISMKLEFHDNVPEDYKLPDYFKAVESLGINFPPHAQTLKLGSIESKFSTFSLSTKSVLNAEDENEHEDELVQPSQSAIEQNISFTSPVTIHTQHQNSSATVKDAYTTNLSESMSSVNLKEKEIRCICECDSDDVGNSIKCDSCSTYQHKACYKLLDDQEVTRHICVNCHEPSSPSKTCTAPDLVNDKKRKDGALYRRALLLCLSNFRVSSNTFVTHLHMSRQTAMQIFNRLDIDGCLRPSTGKGNVRTIKTEHLKDNILSLYFNDSSKNIAETSMETEDTLLYNDVNNPSKNKKRLFNEGENILPQKELPTQRKRPRYATVTGSNNILLCS